MDSFQKEYYWRMLERERLVPIRFGSRMVGFITYYIGTNPDKYVRDNPWDVLDDEPTVGTVCFVDQLITDKNYENWKYSRKVWHDFRDFIRNSYPNVEVIRWNRVKEGVVHVYYKSITRKRV